MDTVTSNDGTPIAFDRTGEGPAVILVGGAFQVRIDPKMSQLAALLAPHYTVFTYDRRGRGDSGDTAPYAVEREVGDLEVLIKEAGGSAFVFGMSSGAVLALDAAAYGLPTTKLAVYEPPFIVDNSRAALPTDYLTQLTDLLSADRRGDAVALFMTNPAGVPAEFVAGMRQAPFWPAMEAVAHTLAYDGTIMGDTMAGNSLPSGRWESVTAPTLVIDGGASHAWIHNGAQALADVLSNVQRRTLDGQDHDVAPEELAPVLTKFFAV
jgi:pimeloyl-ACP methyl ester carboxylesterase